MSAESNLGLELLAVYSYLIRGSRFKTNGAVIQLGLEQEHYFHLTVRPTAAS